MLKEELKLYDKYKQALQHSYPLGGYVVIKGDEVLGVWHDRLDALKEGNRVYGDVPMLVKDINEKKEVWDASTFGSASAAVLLAAMRNDNGNICE